MKLEVITDEENIGYVLTDLSRKGSEITEYLTHEKNRVSYKSKHWKVFYNKSEN